MKFQWKKFADHVREERESHGRSIRKAAHALKIPKSTWVRAEQGKAIVVPVFLLLSDWMDRDPFQYAIRKPQKNKATPRKRDRG